MRRIETVRQLEALIGQTYMFAIIIALVAFLLAFIIAKTIAYDGGKVTRDHIRRRIWFIVIGLSTAASFFMYNMFYVSGFIRRSSLLASFTVHNIIATISALAVYAVVGVALMFVFRSSKWGSILGKSKK